MQNFQIVTECLEPVQNKYLLYPIVFLTNYLGKLLKTNQVYKSVYMRPSETRRYKSKISIRIGLRSYRY